MDMKTQIYLDYNASAPVRTQVCDAVHSALSVTGNPSSVHAAGRKTYQSLAGARRKIADLVGGLPDQVIFTSGGTEANILAIMGAVNRPQKPKISHILVGATEHPCVLAAVEQTGIPFDIIPVDPDGVINLTALETQISSLGDGICLICVMMANNETGTIQPLDKIAQMAGNHNALVHVDAVQTAGKMDLSGLGIGVCSIGGQTSGIVSLSVSAHKLGGPQGVGALVLKDGHTLSALFAGGGQEQGRRSGTENIPGIVGFGVAADLANEDRNKEMARLEELRDKFEKDLEKLSSDIIFFSRDADRLANTSCFAIPGFSAEKALINLDLEGVCMSSGSACSSGKVTKSHVLRAMGVSDDIAHCALRVSLGWQTEKSDIERAIEAFEKIILRQKNTNKNKAIAS